MTKTTRCFAALCILLSLLPTLWSKAAEPTKQTKISVNGTQSECGALVAAGTTYVPLREFCTALAPCSITWDQKSGQAKVTGDGLTMTIDQEDHYLTANGRCLYLKDGVRSAEGHLYLPVRTLAKAFGATVDWNPDDWTVSVTSGKPIESGSTYYNADDLYWLSRIISAESRGEPLVGQIAVGNVVLNRVHSSAYPDTVRDVIFDAKFGVQFQPVANKTIYNDPAPQSVVAAKICLEGHQVTTSSLYFLNQAIATSSWIVDNCKYVMTIGNHTFYR